MLGTLKIDKFRISIRKSELDKKSLKSIENGVIEYYGKYSGRILSKMGYYMIDVTPTKQSRGEGYVDNNLQMPTEKEFHNALTNIIPDERIRDLATITELHLTMDFSVPFPADEAIEKLRSLKYRRLAIFTPHSNANNKTLYLAPPVQKIKDRNATGALVFSFYNKKQEYKDKHNGSTIVQLNEELQQSDLEQLKEAYNKAENTLDIGSLEILRAEIKLKRQQLNKVMKFLTGSDEKLRLSTIVEKLEHKSLYSELETVYRKFQKDYIFYRTPAEMSESKYTDDELIAELLEKSGNLREYKAIFTDLGMLDTFNDFSRKISKVSPKSDIYEELYHYFVLDEELKEEGEEKQASGECLNTDHINTDVKITRFENVLNPCKVENAQKHMKQCLIIYPVMIWDDS